MKTLWRTFITLAVVYLLLRNPFFWGDVLLGIEKGAELAHSVGHLATARAESTPIVITPCNLDGSCRE